MSLFRIITASLLTFASIAPMTSASAASSCPDGWNLSFANVPQTEPVLATDYVIRGNANWRERTGVLAGVAKEAPGSLAVSVESQVSLDGNQWSESNMKFPKFGLSPLAFQVFATDASRVRKVAVVEKQGCTTRGQFVLSDTGNVNSFSVQRLQFNSNSWVEANLTNLLDFKARASVAIQLDKSLSVLRDVDIRLPKAGRITDRVPVPLPQPLLAQPTIRSADGETGTSSAMLWLALAPASLTSGCFTFDASGVRILKRPCSFNIVLWLGDTGGPHPLVADPALGLQIVGKLTMPVVGKQFVLTGPRAGAPCDIWYLGRTTYFGNRQLQCLKKAGKKNPSWAYVN